MVAIAVFAMLLVTTPLLSLLEIVSELVDLWCKNPNFFFKDREMALHVAISSLQRSG